VPSGADFGDLGGAQSAGHFYGFLFGAVRFLAFVGALLFVGGLVVARWLWPQSIERRDVRALLLTLWSTGVVGTLLTVPFQAGYASTGGWSKFLDSGALQDVLDARYGHRAPRVIFSWRWCRCAAADPGTPLASPHPDRDGRGVVCARRAGHVRVRGPRVDRPLDGSRRHRRRGASGRRRRLARRHRAARGHAPSAG
jgi:hypothetical protein